MQLCLDASTSVAVLGLFDNGVERAARRIPGARGDILPDLCQQVLADVGITAADITSVACGVGPGSFTGIRIALAFAQGMVFRRALPLHGLSTLRAALCHPDLCTPEALARPRLALLDALRGESYALRLEPGVLPWDVQVAADCRIPLSALPAWTSGETLVIAEGKPDFQATLPPGWLPMSECVCAQGLHDLARHGNTGDGLPNYLRLSSPEELRTP